MSNKEREGTTQGVGGLYKKLQIPMLPPKSPRSGVNPFLSRSRTVIIQMLLISTKVPWFSGLFNTKEYGTEELYPNRVGPYFGPLAS